MLQSMGELDRHDSMELKVRESGLATKWRQVVAIQEGQGSGRLLRWFV